jgi:hypothetical protein
MYVFGSLAHARLAGVVIKSLELGLVEVVSASRMLYPDRDRQREVVKSMQPSTANNSFEGQVISHRTPLS